MKNLLLIFTLLVSTVVFSSPSYADWTKVSKEMNGDIQYVDFEKFRKVDGYIYFWILRDFKNSLRSSLRYLEHDCKRFRFKILDITYHKKPMGRGMVNTSIVTSRNDEWNYPPPNSSNETILKSVCSR
jgi:hypothetical protein